ncbi:MAG TPA: hypothetical protein VMX94_05285 [Armatimonadota bacterium]|nr:hypothetical protein [Armatimonadota bacterium]
MKDPAIFRKLLIFGIVANVGAILLLVYGKNEAAQNVSWQPYTSKSLGFSLTYPSRWTVTEFEEPDVETETKFVCSEETYFSALTSVKANIKANLFRNKPERLGKPLIVACHETVLADMPRKLKSFTQLNTTEMKVGSPQEPQEAVGTYFEFSMRRGLMMRKMKGMIVSTWNGNKHIALAFVCPDREYENTLPLFETFLESYKPGRILERQSGERMGDILR